MRGQLGVDPGLVGQQQVPVVAAGSVGPIHQGVGLGAQLRVDGQVVQRGVAEPERVEPAQLLLALLGGQQPLGLGHAGRRPCRSVPASAAASSASSGVIPCSRKDSRLATSKPVRRTRPPLADCPGSTR